MASFERIYDMQGFDKVARWQMVPFGGVRHVVLRNGKGLTVTSTTSAVRVEAIPGSELPAGRRDPIETTDRILRVTGQSTGPATLEAKDKNGIVIARLLIDVKQKKSLLLTFNFVTDTGGHFTARSSLSAPRWVNGINRIFNGQANIFVTLLRTRLITIPEDLGVKIRWPRKEDPRSRVMYDLFVNREDADADVNFYLVWNFDDEDDKLSDREGVQMGRIILVEDHVYDDELVMAHELGHYLGGDHLVGARETHHLMHEYANGPHLSRQMVNLLHETIVAK